MDSEAHSEQAIVAALTHIIAHELDVRIPEQDIDPKLPLLEGGLMLDSMVLFELIAKIEERYAVSFPTEDLRTEYFANLEVLAGHVAAMRGSKS
ncbi:MAG: acyl carrier protein [Deltaproteobacteria bacterium]|nr:acyl carrier protein [Deltaproteobacteria bacterium]